MVLHQNISLFPYNTFKINVNVQCLAIIKTEEDIREAIGLTRFRSLPRFVLGGGSNILLTGNQRKFFMKNEIKGIKIIFENQDEAIVEVGAGELWHQLVLWSLERNLGGLENLSLIHGCVGAAPIQNIGAYGTELRDVFHSLDAYLIKTGELVSFTSFECKFGYRDSIFKKSNQKYFISKVRLRLSKKHIFNTSYGQIEQTMEEMKVEKISIRAISDAVIKIRQSKIPDPSMIGNAGSFFKNPIIDKSHFEALILIYPDMPSFLLNKNSVKVPAAYLIERCGWKGKKRGLVGVHERQPLVLINLGGGTGKDLQKLGEDIRQSVFRTFGIQLKYEVNLV